MLPYQGYDDHSITPTYNGGIENYGFYPQMHIPDCASQSTESSSPKIFFKIPKVVHNQRDKFEKDEIFKKNSRDSEIRYTLYRDRPYNERQAKFQTGCREGHTEIANSSTGLVFVLTWNPMNYSMAGYDHRISDRIDGVNFHKEPGKAHIRASLIINGVCVRFRGWIDLDRLEGIGALEFDEEMARVEDEILQRDITLYDYKFKNLDKNGMLANPHDLEIQERSQPQGKKIH
ncbi:core-binding factor subunit beta [Lepeophtheirus salmonis]|uniref:Protein big brotherlike [Bombyx mori] n=1 Tax=Lepeophtheirus salmonis TaxID=72036 RepID=A0A0K2TBP9_LEPSM|nr:core-binding factor subunit beta-like [Lepeophtheirus salmonis]